MTDDDDAEAFARSKREITKIPGRRLFHSIVTNLGDFACDIVFVQYSESDEMKKANVLPEGRPATCLLVVIELTTRFAYAEPLASKRANDVSNAFRKIYQTVVDDEERPFLNLVHDAGTEFDNEVWNQMIRSELPVSIKFADGSIFPQPVIRELVKEPDDHFSLAPLDAFCRTFKRKLENWMIEHETLDWVRALPNVMDLYNNHKIEIRVRDLSGFDRIPRVTRGKKKGRALAHTVEASPVQLRQSLDSKNPVLFNAAHLNDEIRGIAGLKAMLKLKIGDKVRIRQHPEEQSRNISRSGIGPKWAKGSQRWSNKVYNIVSIDGFSFSLKDSDGEDAPRTYRAHELMKVAPDSVDVPDIWEKAAKQVRKQRRMAREGI